MSDAKYYYFHKNKKKWLVINHMKGKNCYFGSFNTEKEAKIAVELFNLYGWTKENRWIIKNKVKEITL